MAPATRDFNGRANKSLVASRVNTAVSGTLKMLTFVLILGLLQFPPHGISPCDVHESTDRAAPLTIKQICEVEQKMSLLTDGMSWKAAAEKLRISRKHLLISGHGATAYYTLGHGYVLAVPYSNFDAARGSAKQLPMRLFLLDGKGRLVKDVEWQQ